MPLQPQRPSSGAGDGDGGQSLPGLRYYEGSVDSPTSSAVALVSSYSTLPSSTSNGLMQSPKESFGSPSAANSGATPTPHASASVTGPSPFARRTTNGTAPVVAPQLTSPLQPASSFAKAAMLQDTPAESVKFVGENSGGARDTTTYGERPRGCCRAAPLRLVTSMQGTVLPEHHGGLPKMGHTAVSYQQDVYVFGGVNSKGQYSNHVFCHEKRSLAWREIRGIGVVPRGRVNHAAVLVDSKIYVFGGHRLLEVFDDFFAYDIATNRWEKITYESSQGPGGVFLHCMIYISSSASLFVLGGVHHREQNSYLGHLFDIRNRVWSGVPPPPSVNPQHLQLVTAAYHEPSNSVVVLGLAESDAAATPCVYVFNPQSFAWRRVETPTAPESPLPFRIEALWTRFLHFLVISGGGLYDAVTHYWMFPFPLSPSSSAVAGDFRGRGGCSNSSSQGPLMPPPSPANKLGFLMLNLQDMSWSLVLCKFPRKLLAEVKTYNAAERRKMERSLARFGGTAAHSYRSSNTTQPSSSDSGVLNLSGLRHLIGDDGGGGVFGQRSRLRTLSTSSSAAVKWGDGDNNSDVSGDTSGSARRSSGALSSFSNGGDRYRRLVNFEDVPEFTRKYALVAVRDAPLKSGKLRPMRYMVLHGGLVEPTDYSMLAFKLRLTRVDTLAATKQSGRLAGLGGTAPYRALRATRGSTDNGDPDLDGDGDAANYRSYFATVDTASSSELLPSTDDGDSDVFSQTFRNSVSDEEVGHNLGDLDGSMHSQQTSLLPTLPSSRNTGNCPRFALQYTPLNAVHTESLLPYANIPVAVLQNTRDVQEWSRNYYRDQRRWLSGKLKDALTESRKLQRLRRAANARSARPTSRSGSGDGDSGGDSGGDGGARNSALPDDLSVGDTDSLLESLYLLESTTNLARGSRVGGRRSSAIQAFEDQLTMEAAVAAVEKKEAPKRRVQDFFEERHLEPFVAEDVAQPPYLNHNNSTSSDGGTKTKKLKKKPGAATTAAKGKNTKAAAEATKKKGRRASSAASVQSKPSVDLSPPPTSLVAIVGQSIAASVGFERLNMRPRGRLGANCHNFSVSGGVGDGNHNELARNVSQLLLRNGLDRFRADDDSVETRRRKARLRWRFLRALVCTGEASYFMYLASQAPFKMRGVTVSSTPGLVLAPELQLVGPSQAYKVPSKPVPYNVSGTVGAIPSSSSMPSFYARYTQMTDSGMVVYRSFR